MGLIEKLARLCWLEQTKEKLLNGSYKEPKGFRLHSATKDTSYGWQENPSVPWHYDVNGKLLEYVSFEANHLQDYLSSERRDQDLDKKVQSKLLQYAEFIKAQVFRAPQDEGGRYKIGLGYQYKKERGVFDRPDKPKKRNAYTFGQN